MYQGLDAPRRPRAVSRQARQPCGKGMMDYPYRPTERGREKGKGGKFNGSNVWLTRMDGLSRGFRACKPTVDSLVHHWIKHRPKHLVDTSSCPTPPATKRRLSLSRSCRVLRTIASVFYLAAAVTCYRRICQPTLTGTMTRHVPRTSPSATIIDCSIPTQAELTLANFNPYESEILTSKISSSFCEL